MEKLIIRENYAPKPSSMILKSQDPVKEKIPSMEERIERIEEKIDGIYSLLRRLCESVETINSSQKTEEENSRAMKKEYISALHCEMDINRQYILREIHRMHNDGSLKGHGDALFF